MKQTFAALCWALLPLLVSAVDVPRFDMFEQSFAHSGSYANPYTSVTATATFTPPGGGAKTIPLFWDGGTTWKVRFSPNATGSWAWLLSSTDPGLNGQSGSFNCTASALHGGIRVRPAFPYHFEHEDGTPFWFFGDTQWRAFNSQASENLSHAAVLHYIDVHAAQGFNFVHGNLLSLGVNDSGTAFSNYPNQTMSPAFWQEVDSRVAYMNQKGITAMIFLAWANGSPSWTSFPDDAARLRYARYVVARYAAYNTAFCVSGEWNETGTKAMYPSIGGQITSADPHGCLVAIHSTRGVEEFATESWMSFGDYQQLYDTLHAKILDARDHNKPVVNSEYAYYLRDIDGAGEADKPNSATLVDIRHASYDIVMAGGYLVTGWGTTYNGGYRDPGPFDVDAAKNNDWEAQVQHVKTLFEDLDFWRLQPADALIVSAPGARGTDTTTDGVRRPPLATYWALAETGQQYVMYCRGYTGSYSLSLGGAPAATYNIRRFDPRTGSETALPGYTGTGPVTLTPPDAEDWVFVLANAEGGNQAPTVSISAGNSTVLTNETVTFNVISSDLDGNITNHVWHWGGSDESLAGPPASVKTHTWSTAGAYDVSLTVTDDGAPPHSADSGTIRIDVVTNLPPVITAADATPNSGFVPLFVTFSAAATDPESQPVSFEWDFTGDGLYDAVGPAAHFTYVAPGHYDPVLRVSDGMHPRILPLTVDVDPVPPAGDPVTVDVQAKADTYTYLTNPNSNYGTSSEMAVGGGTARREIFIRFNVTNVPAGAVVSDARLVLVCSNTSTEPNGGGTLRGFAPVTGQWSETQPTWNSPLAGSDAGGDLATLGPVSSGSTYTFTNLHSLVTGTGRVTFVIRSDQQDGCAYRTKEHTTASQRPVLRISYGGSSYEAWRSVHFTTNELDVVAVSGANSDLDRDGIDNLWEYAGDLDPRVQDAAAGALALSIEDDRLTLFSRRSKTATDLVYSAAVGGSVTGAWSSEGIAEGILADDGVVQTIWTADPQTLSGNVRRFMRLSITKP